MQTIEETRVAPTAPAPVVTAHDLTRQYGSGRDRRARPARRLGRGRERRADRRHGPVGLRQVDAHAHPRRPRQAHRRRRLHRRHGDRRAQRHAADEAAARAHRLHLPVLQPAADADGEGEHRPPALDRRRQARPRVDRGADDRGRPHRPPLAPPLRALRRTAAARRDRPSARLEADGDVRRRADGQPRLPHELRDPRAPARVRLELRPDDRDGHARRARSRDRRPHPLPRRRPDRQGPRPVHLARDPRDPPGGDRLDDRRRPQGTARPQAPCDPDGVRDRARRRDDQRRASCSPTRSARASTASTTSRTPPPTPSSAPRSRPAPTTAARRLRPSRRTCSTGSSSCPASASRRARSRTRSASPTRPASRSAATGSRSASQRTRTRASTRSRSSRATGPAATVRSRSTSPPPRPSS